MRKFNIRIDNVLLGLVIILAMVLAVARWQEKDRVSQIDLALEHAIEMVQVNQIMIGQLSQLIEKTDTTRSNTTWLYNALQGHMRWHAAQESIIRVP